MPADVYAAMVMKNNVIEVDPQRSVKKAVDKMNKKSINTIIVNSKDYTGIFTTEDLVRAVSERGESLENLKVKDCATDEIVYVKPKTGIKKVFEVISRNDFDNVPVIYEQEVCGIISAEDITDYIYLSELNNLFR